MKFWQNSNFSCDWELILLCSNGHLILLNHSVVPLVFSPAFRIFCNSCQSLYPERLFYRIGNVNIGIIFYCIKNSQWCVYNAQSKFDWLLTLSQEYSKLIGWYWKIVSRQLWTLPFNYHYMYILVFLQLFNLDNLYFLMNY